MAKKSKKKNAKKKPKQRRPATTRSTAGPGFDFEDHVAAWLLLKMLSGQPLPGIEGSGIRLQMQTEALKWVIDDLLVTSFVSKDDQRHIAISCKSNVQVSAAGLPSGFMQSAWTQWSKAKDGPLNLGRDRLMLATRGHHAAFQATWTDIKDWATSLDPALAIARINAHAKHRKIFESVKLPAKDVGLSVTDADVVQLIQTIEVAPLDFHLSGSENEKAAIAQCRGLLVDGSLPEGRKLWSDLVAQARNARLIGGTIELSQLWRHLRTQFGMKGHPDFAPSLDRVIALSNDYKNLIESTLPSGLALERKDDGDNLKKKISAEAVCVAHGDSGTGKSALVKTVLDTSFSDALHVWLGPDQLEIVLSEAERAKVGLSYPLVDVLDGSAKASNILIVDAAERLSDDGTTRAKALVAELLARKDQDGKSAWRVVIVGQTEAWANGKLQKLSGAELPPFYELKQLSKDEVRAVLRATPGLHWLASNDEAVSTLANLRTLAWVIAAASRFQGQGVAVPLSLPAIADRLWSYWTDDKTATQRLLMRLGEREANFEHSFAQSELDGPDAAAFDGLPGQCPLRKNARNRIQFQHDLAADWARFQRLKEIADDTPRWAAFAANPLWNGALRMLGQFLLRERVGTRAAWDVAFEAAEQAKDAIPLAADILLDALYLDPNAEAFLNERAEMLFANNASRLIRLLRRFEHVASVPGISPEILASNRRLSLYLEAQNRTPIYGRWPSIARFLIQHREHVAALTSPVVAGLCERWLTTTPVTLGDKRPMPFRKEFAELAHDTARELQLGQAKRIMFLGDFESPIYKAALAAAPDLPQEISEWALEMAQRRPYRADIAGKIRQFRKEEAEEHKRKLETDPKYRERYEERRSGPTSMFSGRKLPPWPLGPLRRVDHHFHETALHSLALSALMRASPDAAAEVLLAVIVEDSPRESYTRSSLGRELALAYDSKAYPTAYWKSPFFSFLQINPDAALKALHQLVDFCTERWAAEIQRDGGSPFGTPITLADGTVRTFNGDFWVFTWSEVNSNHTGQLHSALAALERWLCNLVESGVDISAYIENLLRNSNSISIIGVLINVGKYRTDLFKGPLKPLLAIHHLYVWDYHRVDNSAFAFDSFAWVHEGNAVFDMAKDWVSAPYRKVKLQQITSDLVGQDKDLAEFVLAATAQWKMPNDEKQVLEFRVLVAELDHRNYKMVRDETTGSDVVRFEYPTDVAQAVLAFRSGRVTTQQTLVLPEICRKALSSGGQLAPQSASTLAAALSAIEDEQVDLDEGMKQYARVAAAATLLVKASDWLSQNPAVERQARTIIEGVIEGIGEGLDSIRQNYGRQTGLDFAAYVVTYDWIAHPSAATDLAVMRVLTSGEERAAQVVVALSHLNRALLGSRWWRLLNLALLWAGLMMLGPRYDDGDTVGPRWRKWQRWLRTRSLAENATVDSVNPLAVARRVERLERQRWAERYIRAHRTVDFPSDRRLSGGLETHFLKPAFAWLFDGEADPAIPGDAEAIEKLVLAFWAFEAWCRSGSADEDDKDYKPLSQLGYDVASALAHRTLKAPVATADRFWKPVFALGPKGHYSIGTYLSSWFRQLTETTDGAAFGQRWRPMIEYMLAEEGWTTGRQWFYGQQLERQALGFGAESDLARIPGHASLIVSMKDLYEGWAKKRLEGDQDNLAGLCRFLSSEAGRALRLDGLSWIAEAMKKEPDSARWHRDSTSDSFMSFLNTLVAEDAEAMSKDPKARQALIDLVSHAVARQLDAALALQERVRKIL